MNRASKLQLTVDMPDNMGVDMPFVMPAKHAFCNACKYGDALAPSACCHLKR